MAMFASLPSGFPQLTQAALDHGHGQIEARPADLRSLAERLRDAYAQARDSNYDTLSPGQWRQLPYAYWEGGSAPLPEVEPKLVRRYWGDMLRRAVTSRPTQASRWLAPLWHTYVWSFNPASRHFLSYASGMGHHVGMAVGPLADTLRRYQQRLVIFQPNNVGARLANALLEFNGHVSGWLEEMCLDHDFPGSALGQMLFAALLKVDPVKLRQDAAIGKVLTWPSMAGIQPHRSEFRVPFAEALLLPWEDHRQPASKLVRETLLNTFTSPKTYGDPRWVGRAGYQWQGVAHPAVSVVKRWLAGQSLETFFKALELTADSQWAYREKFWGAYHRNGYVDDAWLVLGSHAKWEIDRGRIGSGLQCGELVNDSPGRRSVLMLQIGDLTFVEWSHNGALRAYKTADPNTPKLYKNRYDRDELADDRSLWMHDADADNQNPHLVHSTPRDGTWQRKARDFIRRNTGIDLRDSEIL